MNLFSPRGLCRSLGVVAAPFVVWDVFVVAANLWKGRKKKMIEGRDGRGMNGRSVGVRERSLWRRMRRRLFLLHFPVKIFVWFVGEDADDEQFYDDGDDVKPAEDDGNPELGTRVLFFPDDGIPCNEFHNSRAGCPKGDQCPFLHQDTAYQCLVDLLRSARVSIDVCVFCITCADLVSILIERQRSGGVAVRVITDSEQLKITGSQIGKLRSDGVKVRHDNSSYLMHHKFAIIDGKIVLNGSFNWTRTAITGNHENLVISKEEYLVKTFRKEFDSLWLEFHPKHQKGFSEKPVRETWVTSDYMK